MATLASPPAPAGTAVTTLEEYLRSSFSPDCDFVDDHLEDRHLGEFLHGKTQLWIGSFLLFRSKEWNIEPIPEQRIRVAGRRVRVCDLAVLRKDLPREDVTVTPPLLCIEILSPEDRISRARLVMQDYLAMGVPQCWLIDPIRREAFVFDQHGMQAVDADGTLQLPESPITLNLAELFAALD